MRETRPNPRLVRTSAVSAAEPPGPTFSSEFVQVNDAGRLIVLVRRQTLHLAAQVSDAVILRHFGHTEAHPRQWQDAELFARLLNLARHLFDNARQRVRSLAIPILDNWLLGNLRFEVCALLNELQ